MNERSGAADEERSQLYLLRVWTVVRPSGGVVCQGKLQSVLSDASYCFNGAAELLALLACLSPGSASSNSGRVSPHTPAIEER